MDAIPPSEPATTQPSVLLASFVRAVRIVAIGFILLGGWWVADLFRVSTREESPIPARPTPAPNVTPDVGADLFAEGDWSVGESGWSLKRAELGAGTLATRMATVGEPLATREPVSPLETQLLDWLRSAGAKSRESDGVRVYSLAIEKAQVRVVTQPLGGFERVRLVQAAWPTGAGLSLFELAPTRPVTGHGAVPPLLPVPAGASVLARRWSGGKVVAELVGPWTGAGSDAKEWADAGWAAETNVPGRPDVGFVVYAKGAEKVQVWKVSPLGPGTTYLLLTRPPADPK